MAGVAKSGMAGARLHLDLPEVAAVIDKLHTAERDGWRKTRLLAVKLAARGKYTSAEVAGICGIAHGHLFRWTAAVREGGIEALLTRGPPGPRPGPPRGLAPETHAELIHRLEAGEFTTVHDARRWLEAEDGVVRPCNTVWSWLKKAAGVLLRPRPAHSRKDPAAAGKFKEELVQRMEALELPAGSKVGLWIMDEVSLGLRTERCRLWALKRSRPVVSRQMKYVWDYLDGSLDIMGGQAHSAHIPSVSQEWDRACLKDPAAMATNAVHVVIRDQAGFHLRDGNPRLPDRVRILNLPPYTPELNPYGQLGDVMRDSIGNKVFATVRQLRKAMAPALTRWWDDSAAVPSLIGRPWITFKIRESAANAWAGVLRRGRLRPCCSC
ncbi:MAG: family transposase [Verrucomicrobiales bacterium]|nr:family transposase [Verrucomicrobiales bacterium]